jgi:hypothetical protein
MRGLEPRRFSTYYISTRGARYSQLNMGQRSAGSFACQKASRKPEGIRNYGKVLGIIGNFRSKSFFSLVFFFFTGVFLSQRYVLSRSTILRSNRVSLELSLDGWLRAMYSCCTKRLPIEQSK